MPVPVKQSAPISQPCLPPGYACLHSDVAIRVRGIKVMTAIGIGLAADVYRIELEDRPNGPEVETRWLFSWIVILGGFQEQKRLQRSVDDETWIFLYFRGVAPIVMDFMSIEGKRRESKQ